MFRSLSLSLSLAHFLDTRYVRRRMPNPNVMSNFFGAVSHGYGVAVDSGHGCSPPAQYLGCSCRQPAEGDLGNLQHSFPPFIPSNCTPKVT